MAFKVLSLFADIKLKSRNFETKLKSLEGKTGRFGKVLSSIGVKAIAGFGAASTAALAMGVTIGRVMGKSEGAVKALQHSARAALRRVLLVGENGVKG